MQRIWLYSVWFVCTCVAGISGSWTYFVFFCVLAMNNSKCTTRAMLILRNAAIINQNRNAALQKENSSGPSRSNRQCVMPTRLSDSTKVSDQVAERNVLLVMDSNVGRYQTSSWNCLVTCWVRWLRIPVCIGNVYIPGKSWMFCIPIISNYFYMALMHNFWHIGFDTWPWKIKMFIVVPSIDILLQWPLAPGFSLGALALILALRIHFTWPHHLICVNVVSEKAWRVCHREISCRKTPILRRSISERVGNSTGPVYQPNSSGSKHQNWWEQFECTTKMQHAKQVFSSLTFLIAWSICLLVLRTFRLVALILVIWLQNLT